jgi:hypothetical protein
MYQQSNNNQHVSKTMPESDFTEGRMPDVSDVSDVSGVSLDLKLFESKDDCRSFFEHTANNL